MTISLCCECMRPSGTGPCFEKLLHRVDIDIGIKTDGPGGQVASLSLGVAM